MKGSARVERKSLDNNDSSHSLKVDPSRTYQTIVGVGSSFTESAAAVWSELSKKQQQLLMNIYFSEGRGYL